MILGWGLQDARSDRFAAMSGCGRRATLNRVDAERSRTAQRQPMPYRLANLVFKQPGVG
jgi:hypothetical protein